MPTPTTDHGMFVRAARWWLSEHSQFPDWLSWYHDSRGWEIWLRHDGPHAGQTSKIWVSSVTEALRILASMSAVPMHLAGLANKADLDHVEELLADEKHWHEHDVRMSW